MNTKEEMRELQQMVRDMHTELLEVNKKCLELAVRLNNVVETLDEDG